MNKLKRRRQQPRVEVAPVHDAQGRVIADKESLTVLWVQQFSDEFAGNVVGVAQGQVVALLCDRRVQAEMRCKDIPNQYQHGFQGMLATTYDRFGALQARLAKSKTGKTSWPGRTT